MRIIFAALLILMPVSVVAQESKPREPDQTDRLEYPITKSQILALPRRNWRPKITLQQALKIAETYAKKEKAKLSQYFLMEARMIPYGSENNAKDVRWFFRWKKENGSIVHSLEIIVSMDGKASRLPSM